LGLAGLASVSTPVLGQSMLFVSAAVPAFRKIYLVKTIFVVGLCPDCCEPFATFKIITKHRNHLLSFFIKTICYAAITF
jgi:hypothetical protein